MPPSHRHRTVTSQLIAPNRTASRTAIAPHRTVFWPNHRTIAPRIYDTRSGAIGAQAAAGRFQITEGHHLHAFRSITSSALMAIQSAWIRADLAVRNFLNRSFRLPSPSGSISPRSRHSFFHASILVLLGGIGGVLRLIIGVGAVGVFAMAPSRAW